MFRAGPLLALVLLVAGVPRAARGCGARRLCYGYPPNSEVPLEGCFDYVDCDSPCDAEGNNVTNRCQGIQQVFYMRPDFTGSCRVKEPGFECSTYPPYGRCQGYPEGFLVADASANCSSYYNCTGDGSYLVPPNAIRCNEGEAFQMWPDGTGSCATNNLVHCGGVSNRVLGGGFEDLPFSTGEGGRHYRVLGEPQAGALRLGAHWTGSNALILVDKVLAGASNNASGNYFMAMRSCASDCLQSFRYFAEGSEASEFTSDPTQPYNASLQQQVHNLTRGAIYKLHLKAALLDHESSADGVLSLQLGGNWLLDVALNIRDPFGDTTIDFKARSSDPVTLELLLHARSPANDSLVGVDDVAIMGPYPTCTDPQGCTVSGTEQACGSEGDAPTTSGAWGLRFHQCVCTDGSRCIYERISAESPPPVPPLPPMPSATTPRPLRAVMPTAKSSARDKTVVDSARGFAVGATTSAGVFIGVKVIAGSVSASTSLPGIGVLCIIFRVQFLALTAGLAANTGEAYKAATQNLGWVLAQASTPPWQRGEDDSPWAPFAATCFFLVLAGVLLGIFHYAAIKLWAVKEAREAASNPDEIAPPPLSTLPGILVFPRLELMLLLGMVTGYSNAAAKLMRHGSPATVVVGILAVLVYPVALLVWIVYWVLYKSVHLEQRIRFTELPPEPPSQLLKASSEDVENSKSGSVAQPSPSAPGGITAAKVPVTESVMAANDRSDSTRSSGPTGSAVYASATSVFSSVSSATGTVRRHFGWMLGRGIWEDNDPQSRFVEGYGMLFEEFIGPISERERMALMQAAEDKAASGLRGYAAPHHMRVAYCFVLVLKNVYMGLLLGLYATDKADPSQPALMLVFVALQVVYVVLWLPHTARILWFVEVAALVCEIGTSISAIMLAVDPDRSDRGELEDAILGFEYASIVFSMMGQAQTGYEFLERYALMQLLSGFCALVARDKVLHGRHYSRRFQTTVAPEASSDPGLDPAVSVSVTDQQLDACIASQTISNISSRSAGSSSAITSSSSDRRASGRITLTPLQSGASSTQSATGVEAEPDHRLVLTKEQVDKLVEQMQTAKFKEQIRELRTYANPPHAVRIIMLAFVLALHESEGDKKAELQQELRKYGRVPEENKDAMLRIWNLVLKELGAPSQLSKRTEQAVAKQMFGRDAIELRDMDHIAEKADRNSQDGGAAARVTARHLLAEFTDEEKVRRISEAAQLTFRLTRVLVE